jgi:hypothetical protein
MHLSLAKQDTLVAHAILDILLAKEISQPPISQTIPYLSLYSTRWLVAYLIKNFANIFNLKKGYKFCGNLQIFRATSLNFSTSQSSWETILFFLLLLVLPSGHFPGRSFTKFNKPNNKSDPDINHHSDSIFADLQKELLSHTFSVENLDAVF